MLVFTYIMQESTVQFIKLWFIITMYIYTRGYLQQQVKAIKASSTNYMRITFNVRKIFHELFFIPENF